MEFSDWPDMNNAEPNVEWNETLSECRKDKKQIKTEWVMKSEFDGIDGKKDWAAINLMKPR